tara:strand:- start:1234 stop:1662 length:429 start_codon:yes stop_codon:yes gene_type:complete
MNRLYARSDGAGTDILGTNASPEVLGVADTYESSSYLDVRDYRSVSFFTRVTTRDAATTLMTVVVEWSMDAATDFPQGAEDVAATGVATNTSYVGEYDVTGLSAPFSLQMLPLPAEASNVKYSIKANLGTTTAVHVQAARRA